MNSIKDIIKANQGKAILLVAVILIALYFVLC